MERKVATLLTQALSGYVLHDWNHPPDTLMCGTLLVRPVGMPIGEYIRAPEHPLQKEINGVEQLYEYQNMCKDTTTLFQVMNYDDSIRLCVEKLTGSSVIGNRVVTEFDYDTTYDIEELIYETVNLDPSWAEVAVVERVVQLELSNQLHVVALVVTRFINIDGQFKHRPNMRGRGDKYTILSIKLHTNC